MVTENISKPLDDKTISRLWPFSRLILSILSVRASHQYNLFSWNAIHKHQQELFQLWRRFSHLTHPQLKAIMRFTTEREKTYAEAPNASTDLVVDGDSIGPGDARVHQHDLV